MAEETISNSEPVPATPLTDAQTRELAVKAYYDANSREEKALVVKKYPVLETIFSAANHA